MEPVPAASARWWDGAGRQLPSRQGLRSGGSPSRHGEMNGNFNPASCSQPNPRGDLSLAAVGQKRVGWAASDSSFPCQKVSKASHTFPSSLRQKNTLPPHSEACLLLPVTPEPREKPLPPARPRCTPAPQGKRTYGHVRGERPPAKSAGERQREGEGGLAPGGLLQRGCVDLPLPPIWKDHAMGQWQLLKPSKTRVLRNPGLPGAMGHSQGGHPQLSRPLPVPHPHVQSHRFPPARSLVTQPPSCSRRPGHPQFTRLILGR